MSWPWCHLLAEDNMEGIYLDLVQELDIADCHRRLQNRKSGAVVGFTGTVREFSKGKSVKHLSFEAYSEMALKQMQVIADEARAKWELHELVMVHALGKMELGDPIVFCGASSAHRDEAFQAARFLIDELKSRVPIWKKEYYSDESEWINATP